MGQSVRRAVLLSAAAAVVGLGSYFGAVRPVVEGHAARSSRMAMEARKPLLGVVHLSLSANSPAILARLDPLSLRPVSPQVEVGEYHDAWALSPDASQVALARGGQGLGIQVIDLEALQLDREIETGIAAEALGWLAPRLLVAGLQRGGTVLVDPLTGRILRRWPGFSFPDASAHARNGLVMLLPRLRKSRPGLPLTRVAGAPRLVVVNTRGRLRSVILKLVRLGVRVRNGMYYMDRAALAVDPVRAQAYVFAADAPVTQVDLRTMRVSYHRLEPLFLRPGKLQGSEARPKDAVLSRERSVLWLGNGQVLVSGRDFVNPRRGVEALFVPAGAMLVDTRSWRWRTLDRSAGGAAFTSGRLVVYEPAWYPGAGPGLRGYALGGRKVFDLLRRARVLDVQVATDWAYVRTLRAVYVVDVSLGRVVRKIVPPVDLVDVIAQPS